MKLFLSGLAITLGIATTVLQAKKDDCKLKVGDIAPSFKAIHSETGKVTKFPDDLPAGRKALIFYPMANTPGCKKEMCSIQKNYNDLKKADITPIGISTSSKEHQKAFKDRNGFEFPLLTATDDTCKLYNVDGFFGAHRHTFLIGIDNKIVAIIKDVDKSRAAQQIIDGFDQAHAKAKK